MVKKAAQATPNQLLRQARLERGWTQKDVADRIGAPLNLNVNRWERGTSKPGAYYVQKLCEVFGKTPAELGLLSSQLQKSDISPEQDQQALSVQAEPRRLWNVPFRRNPFFTGRTDLLALLHDRLNQNRSAALTQPQALTGLGGIGKTQTALEYAFRYRDTYDAIFWIRAASRETLIADFVALAHLLDLPGQDASDQMLVVAAVKRWLEQHEGWLLILDNADELHVLTDFLPTEGAGHLLLTTRAQATGRIASSLPVEKLEIRESMLLLLRRAKLLEADEPLDNTSRITRAQVQRIVHELDGLPLALDQAGVYIEEVGCSLAEYLTVYEQRRSGLLKRQSKLSSIDYPYTVASTWSLSFEQVEQECPAAAELLRLCAFLDPDAIPETIITEGSKFLGSVLEPVATDPLLLNEAIQTLRRYSLIKRDPEAKILNLHRLVQVVLKDGLDEQTKSQWAERAILAVNAAFPETSFDTWPLCELYMPHVQACVGLIDEYQVNFPQAVRLLHQAGIYLRDRGLYEQAEPLLKRALGMSEKVVSPEHPDTARLLNDLGWLYYHLGKYEQAESRYKSALIIRKQVLGAHHPDTATTLNDLGLLYENQGKYEQAEPLLQQALAIREEVFGIEHADVAESLNNLAILYYLQGRYEQAVQLMQQALVIREKVLGPDHPVVGESLNNLAFLYRNKGKYEQAELLYQHALRIREQSLGAGHSLTALTLDNLGLLYQAQGKNQEAEPLHQRALAIFEKVLGSEHPDTAIALYNLAKLYHAEGQYERAQPYYLRSIAIFERVLGSEHSRVAQCLYDLAQLSIVRGQYEQAEQYFQRSLSIQEKALGTDHPDTSRVREDYDELLGTLHENPRTTRQLGDVKG
jgi:tetratricopeptide (TPR) repeat protein/transcriptional regulator with XRE-family HTH domain